LLSKPEVSVIIPEIAGNPAGQYLTGRAAQARSEHSAYIFFVNHRIHAIPILLAGINPAVIQAPGGAEKEAERR
jgi:hypothetical protein